MPAVNAAAGVIHGRMWVFKPNRHLAKTNRHRLHFTPWNIGRCSHGGQLRLISGTSGPGQKQTMPVPSAPSWRFGSNLLEVKLLGYAP